MGSIYLNADMLHLDETSDAIFPDRIQSGLFSILEQTCKGDQAGSDKYAHFKVL